MHANRSKRRLLDENRCRKQRTVKPGRLEEMAWFEPTGQLTREELAWELVEIFDDLEAHQINEVLAKNVPLETLRFFASYAQDFGESQAIGGETLKRLPNLLLLGYLLRVVEERLAADGETFEG
jgi:hypothetical protein